MKKKPPPVTLRKPPAPSTPVETKVEQQARLDAFVYGGERATNRVCDKSTSKRRVIADDFRRSTYYLRPEQIRAMKLKAVTEGRNVSELVREAIDRYLG